MVIATFFIDTTVLAPLAGFATVAILAHYKKFSWILLSGILAWLEFVGIAGGLYLDYFTFADLPLVGSLFAIATSGNDFMWNFEARLLFGNPLIASIPTYTSWLWNGVAICFFFIVYPLMIALGVELGKIVFGRSAKQTGIWGLLPWNAKK